MNPNWSIIPIGHRTGYIVHYGRHPLGEYYSHAQAVAACKGVENFILSNNMSEDQGKKPATFQEAKFGKYSMERIRNAEGDDKPKHYRGIRQQGKKWFITHPKGATRGFDTPQQAVEARKAMLLERWENENGYSY